MIRRSIDEQTNDTRDGCKQCAGDSGNEAESVCRRSAEKAKDIRVAAYGRVSTDELAQQTSYEGQKSYYTKLINEKEGWTFAGMYADEAISGTNRNHRTEFNQMMQDALDGKIDYIITKSISRFARNTVDTLNCVRQLRQCDPPIGVYFEKENIDTLDASGELLLTILSALAQEESNSISKNISWSIQKRFQEGLPLEIHGRSTGIRTVRRIRTGSL